jgi:DNA (cytosine-5)-methyltransferase 1
VPGHVSKGFDTVSRDLFEMGYEVEAGEFAAAETGAPHLRKRLFILAYREGELWQRIVREGAGCG